MNRLAVASELLKLAKSLIGASEHEKETIETWIKATLAFTPRWPIDAVLEIQTDRFSPVRPDGERISKGAFKRMVMRNTDIVSRMLGFPVTAVASKYVPSGGGAFGHLGGGKRGQYHSSNLRPVEQFFDTSKAQLPQVYSREEAQAAVEAYHAKYEAKEVL